MKWQAYDKRQGFYYKNEDFLQDLATFLHRNNNNKKHHTVLGDMYIDLLLDGNQSNDY